jgi:hypothetical protein
MAKTLPGALRVTTTLKSYPDRDFASSESLITLPVFATITMVSVVGMLLYTSPEFSWDEADYLAQTANHWGLLWGGFGYDRHAHGPMAIYLAKLGQEMLPTEVGSLEDRSRFFAALLGSMAIGFLYWTLRHSFRTSRAAAFVGSGLLLFSVIRVEETPIMVNRLSGAANGQGCRWTTPPLDRDVPNRHGDASGCLVSRVSVDRAARAAHYRVTVPPFPRQH